MAGETHRIGIVLPNISDAMIAPSVRTSSSSLKTSAASALPVSSMSRRTPDPVHEPRLCGHQQHGSGQQCAMQGMARVDDQPGIGIDPTPETQGFPRRDDRAMRGPVQG